MKSYFVRFKNFKEDGTGCLHEQVLKKEGKVLWGQWRNGASLLNRKTKAEMNDNAPFILYALDKNAALIKLTVTNVYDKEEVVAAGLTHLIPSYYTINTPCSAFYLVSNIEILPPEAAMSVVNINTNKPIYEAAQVNGATPWRVQVI